MSNASINDLLVPPKHAFEAPGAGDWEEVEKQLGTSLPHDYKRFIEAYGTGSINDFLFVLNPFSSNRFVNLIGGGRLECEAYRLSQADFPDDYRDKVYPETGGILPFAATDNGEILYWRTGGDPNRWTVTVYEARGPKHFDFRGTMTDLLVGVLTGSVRCDTLPRGLSTRTPLFKPVDVRDLKPGHS